MNGCGKRLNEFDICGGTDGDGWNTPIQTILCHECEIVARNAERLDDEAPEIEETYLSVGPDGVPTGCYQVAA